MRVLQISTFDTQGGAAKSAFRLFQGLRELGQVCRMLVARKSSSEGEIFEVERDESSSARRVRRDLATIRKECIDRHRTAISNTLFSLPTGLGDISLHRLVSEADVLHLHWVTHFLSPAVIGRLQSLGKPVLWTLHDQRPFTGGCHFSAGCRRFEGDCDSCPQLARDVLGLVPASHREGRAFCVSNLTLICPSRWMGDCAQASSLFQGIRSEVIPYGVDTRVFQPRRAEARAELGLAPGALYLAAGADVGTETRKGYGPLAKALGLCLEEPGLREAVREKKIELLFFGSEKPLPGMNFPARWLGRLDSEEDLARVYAAADAFLLPSLEDNLPNTMLESLCCGTPVIGFETGGIPEVIEHGRNGLLAPVGNVELLARGVLEFARTPGLRQRLATTCAAESAGKFSLELQARRHIALYEQLLKQRPQPRAVPPAVTDGFAAVYPTLLQLSRRERRERHWRRFLSFFTGLQTRR